ncbi:MAG: type I DNA topoisomerase, partial [Flavobacteriales bacterium]|nr:type I DNA topoisomerase [Flavobacteriales bacterium]
MAKNLVIVESPAKAKTIEKFLGADYKVESSFGHIADLPSKNIGIDVENGYAPQYEIDPEKKELVKKLKNLSKNAEMVYLASDEDREGEAIAWHLYENLGLNAKNSRRIVFHEITKNAILHAIEAPRTIDINLVNAQQARRVLDRLVGYEISPLLWKKIKSGLSAGRVQSVAVRLIVEREREIQAFASQSFFKVSAVFSTDTNATVKAEMSHRFPTEKEAMDFLQSCLSATFAVDAVETKPATRTPAPPFTTSTLQQEAARKLGFSVSQTMTLAQRLYEAGLITYMRTDSVNLSTEALSKIKTEVARRYGENYSKERHYHTTSKGAQEAHEAIRPTYMEKEVAGEDERQKKLYNLIWRRAIACQMAEARLERTTAQISVSTSQYVFSAEGEVLLFDGFLKVYGYDSTDDDDETQKEGILPKMSVGQKLTYGKITATERFTKAPARYGEAALVKKLEELGIGRPSTYAPIISTIQRRGYVEKGDREGTPRSFSVLNLEKGQINTSTQTENYGSDRGKLVPMDIACVVNDFLVEYFPNIVDYKFTAEAEENFDAIAEGKMDWVNSTDAFYKDFHHRVDDVAEHAERSTGERILGKHPENGKQVLVRIGRFGPMVQIGKVDDEEKPTFASLLKGQSINDITLQEALDLFKLPRTVGEYQGKKVTAAIGRFG